MFWRKNKRLTVRPGIPDDASTFHNNVIIGAKVPIDRSDTIRIGHGNVYLEIADGKARIVGAETDEATEAVLRGISLALETALTVIANRHGWEVAHDQLMHRIAVNRTSH